MKILYTLLKYVFAFICFLIFIFCLKVFFDIDFFEEFESIKNPKTENNLVDKFVNKKFEPRDIDLAMPYKYGFKKEDFEKVELDFIEQFKYIDGKFGYLTYRSWVFLTQSPNIEKIDSELFYNKFNELENNYKILKDALQKDQKMKILNLSEIVEEDALYILEIGRSYKNIINNYNFINEYCTENIFEEKKFFNEIPFSKNNNYEFQKIYMENIVPHFNKVCINFKEIEDFEKYEIAVKLIDPNFEYERTVKKINEIINYTFDNIFSDEGILIEIQD